MITLTIMIIMMADIVGTMIMKMRMMRTMSMKTKTTYMLLL